MLERDKAKKGRDEILDGLKSAVKEDGMKKHEWDEKAEDSLVGLNKWLSVRLYHSGSLRNNYYFAVFFRSEWRLYVSLFNLQRVIQVNTLEDRSVHDKNQWDSALRFMEATVKDKLEQSEFSLCYYFVNVTSQKHKKAC